MPTEVEIILRLLLATGLGAIIGYERELAKKPAGFRTHLLVCLGATIFTLTSIYGFGDGVDPSRVAAGVVAGVGFLGAGTIIRTREGLVVGLTTAASIWAVAAIGLASGAGMYILAAVATLIILVTLRFPWPRGR